MENSSYNLLVNSELNFMRVIQDYLAGYIQNYCDEGLITHEQKEEILKYHNKKIDDYVCGRVRSAQESGVE